MVLVKVLSLIFLTFSISFSLVFSKNFENEKSGCVVHRRNATENSTLLNDCDLNVIEFGFSIFHLFSKQIHKWQSYVILLQ